LPKQCLTRTKLNGENCEVKDQGLTTEAGSRRFEVIIPTHYNDGSPIEPHKISRTHEELNRIFGGSTSFPVMGGWIQPGGGLQTERNIKLQVDALDTRETEQLFRDYRVRLEKRFGQFCIYVISYPITQIQRPPGINGIAIDDNAPGKYPKGINGLETVRRITSNPTINQVVAEFVEQCQGVKLKIQRKYEDVIDLLQRHLNGHTYGGPLRRLMRLS
jgi:hypothetical protein